MTKFINTNVFTQIDWEKEIVESNIKKDSDEQIDTLHAFLIGWISLKEKFTLEYIKNIEEEYQKENTVRMLEYFYAKFLYHHGIFYDKDKEVDIKKYIVSRKNNPSAVQLPFQELWKLKLKKSKLPLSKLEQLAKGFLESEEQHRINSIPEGGYYQEGKRALENAGLKIYEPEWISKERKHSDRNEYLTLHDDGTVYFLYVMKGERTKEKIKEKVDEHHTMISIYHNHIVKPIYDELCKFPALGNIWVMNGGGGQCQVFFGNDKGYIASMGLDMRSNKQKEVTGPKNYSFIIEGKRNDDILEGVKLPNCKVSLCREHWKDHLDTIEYYKKDVV
jgi:hypothetical protein